MTTRKKTKKRAKPHYVRAKKRKGASSSSVFRRFVTVALLLLVLAAVILGIIAGFRWIGRQLFSENRRFEIQHLVISTDGKLKETFIRENIELTEGDNLFGAALEDIEKILLSIPDVESVYLERKLPHTLIVDVSERLPVARIRGTEERSNPYVIDRHGYVLRYRRSADSLPLIKGLDVELRPGVEPKLEDVYRALEVIAICNSKGYLRDHARIESIDVSPKYDFMDIRLGDGIRVRMPRYSLKKKLLALDTLLAIERGKGKRVREVDLTVDTDRGDVPVPVSHY